MTDAEKYAKAVRAVAESFQESARSLFGPCATDGSRLALAFAELAAEFEKIATAERTS